MDDRRSLRLHGDVSGSGIVRVLPMLLLLLAALPDAMFAPVLKTILVDRYDVGLEQAFWFMSVNLAGILLVVPLLPALRRAVPPVRLIVLAAVANGVLYALMALPLGLVPTLCLRALEGGPDLLVLAGVLSMIGREDGAIGAGHRGLRFGLAGSILMIALVCGLLVGGFLSRHGAGVVFGVAAIECLLLAVVAFAFRRVLPVATPVERSAGGTGRYPIWPAMLMGFADRGLAGALTLAGSLYMVTSLGYTERLAGSLLAMNLFLLAICSGLLGIMADQFGVLRVRVVSAAVYGLCFIGLSLSAAMPMGWLVAMLCLMGVAGGGLVPTSYAIAYRHGSGSVDMGLLQAAGQWGYFAAIAIGGLVVGTHADELSPVVESMSAASWSLLLVVYGLVYLGLNAVAVLGVLRRIGAASGTGPT